MAAIVEDGKLRLSGYVGDYYWDDGFTASDVVIALASIDAASDLAVHINSGGGMASEGAAIHALLKARPGPTVIVVEGIAASAASLIAMAGDIVTMSAGAVMMIHDPSGFTAGTSADHSKSIEALEALATAYARVYADKSGKTADECRAIMREERWFTPEQAVAEGFADDTTEGKTQPVAAFDYRAYAHAPKRLTALAKSKDWRPIGAEKTAKSAVNPGPQEKPMTDKERADALAAELATLKASTADPAKLAADAVKADRERRAGIMALEEAKGREALAEHLFAKGESVDDAKATLAASPKADTEGVDPAAYEARRATGAGMNGKGTPPPNVNSQAAATAGAIANMKKLLGKETQ